jgi:hypothetical protein
VTSIRKPGSPRSSHASPAIPAHRLDELLPWNWRPQPAAIAALAA